MPRSAVDISARIVVVLIARIGSSSKLNAIDEKVACRLVHQQRTSVGLVVANGKSDLFAVGRDVHTVTGTGGLLVEQGGPSGRGKSSEPRVAVVVAGAHGDHGAVGREVNRVDIATALRVHGSDGGPCGGVDEVGVPISSNRHSAAVG